MLSRTLAGSASKPKNQSIQIKSACCVKRYWTEIALRGTERLWYRISALDAVYFAKTTAFFYRNEVQI